MFESVNWLYACACSSALVVRVYECRVGPKDLKGSWHIQSLIEVWNNGSAAKNILGLDWFYISMNGKPYNYFQRGFCYLLFIMSLSSNNKPYYYLMYFSFLFIDWEPTTWLVNNCLQICALLQIVFCTCVIETTYALIWKSVPRAVRKWYDRFSWSSAQRSNDKFVIAKYRDLSESRRSISCLSLRLRQISGQVATDKARYFSQPRSIIVNC